MKCLIRYFVLFFYICIGDKTKSGLTPKAHGPCVKKFTDANNAIKNLQQLVDEENHLRRTQYDDSKKKIAEYESFQREQYRKCQKIVEEKNKVEGKVEAKERAILEAKNGDENVEKYMKQLRQEARDMKTDLRKQDREVSKWKGMYESATAVGEKKLDREAKKWKEKFR